MSSINNPTEEEEVQVCKLEPEQPETTAMEPNNEESTISLPETGPSYLEIQVDPDMQEEDLFNAILTVLMPPPPIRHELERVPYFHSLTSPLNKSFNKLVKLITTKELDRFKSLESIMEKIFGILKEKSIYKLESFIPSKFESKCLIVLTAPLTNDQTLDPSINLVQILDDFENCLKVDNHLQNNTETSKDTDAAATIRVDCLTKSNRCTLRFICQGIQVELIPALNLISGNNSNYDTTTPAENASQEEEMKKRHHAIIEILGKYWSSEKSQIINLPDEQKQLYENSLLELHWDFLNNQSDFTQNMIYLIKFWDNASIWIDCHSHPLPLACDELIELLTINASQREEVTATNDSVQPSYLRAFRKLLVSLNLIEKLRLNMYAYKNEEGKSIANTAIAAIQQQPCYVISVSNPFNNFLHIEHNYLLNEMVHGNITLDFSYIADLANAEEEDDEIDDLLAPLPDIAQLCVEPLAVLIPYMFINATPEYVTALRVLVDEIEKAKLSIGSGGRPLESQHLLDLVTFITEEIKSGKLQLLDSTKQQLPPPTTLNEVFKIFNLIEPPTELETSLNELKNSNRVTLENIEMNEFFNEMIINEFIMKIAPYPKQAILTIIEDTNTKEKSGPELIQWLTNQFNCKHFGFNIRTPSKFNGNSMAFMFLQMLARNVELNVQGTCAGHSKVKKANIALVMEQRLKSHTLKFINNKSDMLGLVQWIDSDDEDSQVSTGNGNNKKTGKGKGKNNNNIGNGHRHQHQDFDMTYVTSYKTFVSKKTHFVAVSMNW